MGWLTAAEALSVLAVRPQTLYANVSRRRIRARPDPKDPRRSLYNEGDVRRIAGTRAGARKAERVAAAAIEWGDPILPSAISTVASGRLWYRGQDAVELAGSRTLEEIAALLWDDAAAGRAGGGGAIGGPKDMAGLREMGAPREHGGLRPITGRRARRSRANDTGAASALGAMFIAMAGRAERDPPSHGRSAAVLRGEALEVFDTLAGSVVGTTVGSGSEAPLHERLAAIWRRKPAADALRRALVLLADHELNASTFAVRVTVSTGASLASGILAGLATLSGPLHGRAALGVVELIRTRRQRNMQVAVRDWLTYGRPLSGFGHPLYPDGDIRAEALLRAFAAPPEYRELHAAGDALTGERPNIDFALAAMADRFRLPPDAPLVLFALARSVGWLAHAMEQALAGHLIRPRARYVGPPLARSG
ncbi:MAG TPA: citrate synthase [Steroidobacteraceae bacterium]|nr:citrate synthase [Steroidobacteraceae bacterium]